MPRQAWALWLLGGFSAGLLCSAVLHRFPSPGTTRAAAPGEGVACPGVVGLRRCWLLGALGASCADTCRLQGMAYAFEWPHRDGPGALPNRSALSELLPAPLRGRIATGRPVAPVECWQTAAGEGRPAHDSGSPPMVRRRRLDPPPFPAGGAVGAAEWRSPRCQLACPCALVAEKRHGPQQAPVTLRHWPDVLSLRVLSSGCAVLALHVGGSEPFGASAGSGAVWGDWITGPITALEGAACRGGRLCRLRVRARSGRWHGPYGAGGKAQRCEQEPRASEADFEWHGLGEVLTLSAGSLQWPEITHLTVQWQDVPPRQQAPPQLLAPLPPLLPGPPAAAPVCFLHFHKAGGTEICDLVRNSIGRNLTAYQLENNCNLDAMRTPWAEGRPPRPVAGNSPCSLLERAPPFFMVETFLPPGGLCRGLRYATSRVLSHLRVHQVTEEEAMEWLVGGRIPDRRSWHLSGAPVLDNFYTRTLGGEDVYYLPAGSITAEHLARAEQVLARFEVVIPLTQHHWAEALGRASRAWGWPLVSAFHDGVPQGGAKSACYSASFVSLVAQRNAWDYRLYAAALRQFESGR
eukprot:TRINITY_DN25996_c0_g1_i3.p1 TRINITY_DN25996_c0_g1~~TRINITY_DN25996_c0_g1_i3.p1  ORF type:complete len:577 (+),score=71.62 TRINITY_DN25996_c0_g1_i3:69-1799(+)